MNNRNKKSPLTLIMRTIKGVFISGAALLGLKFNLDVFRLAAENAFSQFAGRLIPDFVFHDFVFRFPRILTFLGIPRFIDFRLIDWIPFFNQPENRLLIEQNLNLFCAVALVTAVTAATVWLATLIVTSDIPKELAHFINVRRAEFALCLAGQLERAIAQVEVRDLDIDTRDRLEDSLENLRDKKK